tara:strand:- start:3392 stop:4705 length:1314 start_codon:yes stop_codon:yes gene_type:complete
MEPIKENELFIELLKVLRPDVYINDPFKSNFNKNIDKKFSYSFVEQFFFSSFYYKKKINSFNEMKTNIFISEKDKNKLSEIFFKAQLLYKLFKKFYIKKTYHKYKIHNNDRDLNLIPLTNYDNKFIVSIVEDNIIYKYTIFDLLKIIKNSLCYSYAMFVEPRHPKNPYTNIEFSLYNLYNIYFITKNLDINFPILLNIYFQSNFDLDNLTIDYESIIRDEIIKNYYSDASNTKKYNDIINILSKYKKFAPTIVVHRRFSKNEVIDKLGFLLELNLYVNYSYNPSKRVFYKKILKKKLQQFSEKNPLFGRIIFSRNSNNTSIFTSRNIHNSIYDYGESVYNFNSPQARRTISPIRNWFPTLANNENIIESETNTIISNASNISTISNTNEESTEDDYTADPIIEEPDSDDNEDNWRDNVEEAGDSDDTEEPDMQNLDT